MPSVCMISSKKNTAETTLIVGGGPAGCLLALELHHRGLPSLLLDARAAGAPLPERTLALSWLTIQTLLRHQVIQHDVLTPIEHIQITQHNSFGNLRLTAQEAGVEALGYTMRYSTLLNALENALKERDIPLRQGIRIRDIGCSASWGIAFDDSDQLWSSHALVLAEGGTLKPKGWKYHDYHYSQSAWMATLPISTHGVAYERFTERGVLALLPAEVGCTLIFSLDKTHEEQWLTLSKQEQDQWLAKQCPPAIEWSSNWKHTVLVPLRFQALRSEVKPPLWVIGNAAQILHPVAGLGFNLGVRDVLDTASSLHQFFRPSITLSGSHANTVKPIGRELDRRWIQSLSHNLARWGHYDTPAWKCLRTLGLATVQVTPPLKSALLQSLIWGF
ncbi:MAG: FAD-dependent monooxygenase [Pseudomonadota bacterium]